MKSKMLLAMIAVIAVGCIGCARRMIVYEAPPPRRVEVVTVAPGATHVWVEGFWSWDRQRRWEWMPGHWEIPPEPRMAWAPGHWRRHEGREEKWEWEPGEWRR